MIENFRYANAWRRFNRFAQITLSITFVIGLNILANQLFARFDLTANKRFSLAPETRAYLTGLSNPVEIIVTLRQNPNDRSQRILYERVRDLLQAYEEAGAESGRQLLEIRYLDVYRQRREAENLARALDLREPDVVLVRSGDQRQLLRPADLVAYSEDGESVFQGERALTEAIINVSGPGRQKVYFLTGHGEMGLDDVSPDRGLSQMGEDLQLRGLDLESLDLTTTQAVPEDADLVALVSPQVPLLPREVEALEIYLDAHAGRLLALLDPLREHGLEELLFDWGVTADDMVVLEVEESYQGTGDFFLIRRFYDHPASRYLRTNSISVKAQLARPVRPNPGRPQDERLTVSPVMSSSPASWAERSYRQGTFQFDAGIDLQGPVVLATAAERQVPSHLGINLASGRLLTFGSGGLFSNQNISSLGNRMLLFRSLDWLLEEESMLSIPARTFDSIEFSLSRQELIRMGLLLLVVPGIVGLFGLTVFAIRKL